jgi:peptide chain release factor 1
MKPFLRQQLARYADRLGELEFLLSREDIMKDMKQFLLLSREHTEVASVATRWSRYQQREADLAATQDLLTSSSDDADMASMAQEEIDGASAEISQLEGELQRMLLPKDPDDARNAFIEIRAGTGGDESALFAGDLLRMYSRFCERQGWKTEILSESLSELGGFKDVVLRVEGDHVYGALKFESGGHRVQRVPATETQGRIHTSACTVAVLAEPDETVAIQINPADLRIDTYRASGAGGQHINKTDSAVRITHLPTGIVVSCQNERSQHKNKDVAMKVLRSRLYDMKLKEQQAELDRLGGEKQAIAFGSQIRSYVLHPYQMVKDHRTKYQEGDVTRVLDGDIDSFIKTYLMAKATGTLGVPTADDE